VVTHVRAAVFVHGSRALVRLAYVTSKFSVVIRPTTERRAFRIRALEIDARLGVKASEEEFIPYGPFRAVRPKMAIVAQRKKAANYSHVPAEIVACYERLPHHPTRTCLEFYWSLSKQRCRNMREEDHG
jgi:hypothetical protein